MNCWIREPFDTLWKTNLLVDNWRQIYNRIRSYSAPAIDRRLRK